MIKTGFGRAARDELNGQSPSIVVAAYMSVCAGNFACGHGCIRIKTAHGQMDAARGQMQRKTKTKKRRNPVSKRLEPHG